MLQSSKACADMQLLPRVCFCFLTLSGLTFGDRSGPGVRVVVSEGDDAILPCSLSTKESVVQKLFDWKMDSTKKEVFMYDAGVHYNNGRSGQDKQFKGRVSHFPDQLQFGNASIIIRNTIVADSGDYTCEFPHLQSEEITNIKLVVEGRLKVRNIPGASPEPYVRMLKEKGVLECKVPGASPKPTVEWRDSDNKPLKTTTIQEREDQGRFYIITQTTVTEPGCYHCVATQMDILHQIPSSETCVPKDVASGNVMIRATVVTIIFGITGIIGVV